jgi:nicotinamidase/pyrazinamidase
MPAEASDVLIVVDVQNDFCPGGALPVMDGHRVVPVINQLMHHFDNVVFTRDWHPSDHCSFDDDPQFLDGSWPEHCVQDTPGAEFHPNLHVGLAAPIVSKGTDPDREMYSDFDGTKLHERFQAWGIRRVYVCGLATDYCVKHTALDAQRLGYETSVITDACRGVDNPKGSAQKALDEMKAAGIRLCTSGEFEG